MRKALLGLVAAFCASCVQDNNDSTQDIFPLSTGNTWNYVDSTVYRSEPGGLDSVHVDSSQLTVLTTKAIVVNGTQETVYPIVWINNATHQPEPNRSYSKIEGHSFYSCGAEQDTAHFFDKILHLQYPAQKDTSYPTHLYNFASANGVERFDVDTLTVKVLNTDTLWAGPAGKFSAVKYQASRARDGWSVTVYYGPGIGYLGYESKSGVVQNGISHTTTYKKFLKSYALQ